MSQPLFTRRSLFFKGAALSVVGLSLLAELGTAAFGRRALAAEPSKDVDVLNSALGLEHQLIGAYQISADSGLLKQTGLNIVLLFQSHHKAHRDALAGAVQKLGGTPAEAQTSAQYATALNASSLRSQNDVLELALKLELGATNAYTGIVSGFQDHGLAKLSSRVLADESMHWTALASTLAHPLPANALTFGA